MSSTLDDQAPPPAAWSNPDHAAIEKDPSSAPMSPVREETGPRELKAISVLQEGDCTIWSGDLTGYQVRDLETLTRNPRAGSPEYAYLLLGKEAVDLPGPRLTAQDPLEAAAYDLTMLRVSQLDHVHQDWTRDIYDVKLDGPDGELRFVVHGTDLEGEVELRQVRLCADDGGLSSHFVFAAAGIYGGVAHALTIQAQLDGTLLHASAPVSVEVREQ